MAVEDGAWRTGNVGRLLFSSKDRFIRDKLRAVHAAGFDLVTEVHMALVQNLDLDGTRLTVMAMRARITKQSMQELVDKVQSLGLVERRPDPDDRRAKVVAFTPAGLAMMERLRQGVAAAERRLAGVGGAAFVADMKCQLLAYVSAAGGIDGEASLSSRNIAWRTRNAGRILSAAADVFSRDVLRSVHEGGFGEVAAVHMTLIRHLDLSGTRLTEIAWRARMTKQAMAELVDRTEELGLVYRIADPDDGRAKVVVFTPIGLRLLEPVRSGIKAAEKRMSNVTGTAFLRDLRMNLATYVASALVQPRGERCPAPTRREV